MISEVVVEKLAIAAFFGAGWTVDNSREDLVAKAKAAAPEGFEVIINASSIPAVINHAMPLRQHGQFIFHDWYLLPSALDLKVIHMRLPACHFPCGHSGPHGVTAMRWASDRCIDCWSVMTQVIRPEQAQEFYRDRSASSGTARSAAIDWRTA